MKIIEMSRFTVNGEPICIDPINDCYEDVHDWWCVIETKEEEFVYDKFVCENKGLAGETNAEHIWNEMVKHAGIPQGLAWGDDDIYGYIRPDEVEPEVGETMTDSDGDTWIRTA